MTIEHTLVQRALQLWVDTFNNKNLPSAQERILALAEFVTEQPKGEDVPQQALDNSEAFMRIDELIKKIPEQKKNY